MNDKGSTTDDWLDLQRRYWEGWAEMGRTAMGLDRPKRNPWDEAMGHWWQAFAPAATDPAKVFMDRMLEQGRVFFGLVEQLTSGLGPAGGVDGATAGWEALNRTLRQLQDAFSGAMGADRRAGDDPLARLLGFWELPLDNWQRMASTLAPTPGDWLRNMPHGPVQDGLDRVLSAPGLGYAREEQAQYQELVRRGLDYQRALADYAGFFSQLGVKSVQRMRLLLQAHGDEDRPIDSARGLYDAWIGCCEEVYAEEVGTRDYARIHGRLVNAQMALKQRLSTLVDEGLGALNMPTRSELRTLQDRLQETRRENKQLRHDLEQLRRQLEPKALSANRPATRKKAAVRKQTSAKVGGTRGGDDRA